MSVKRSRTISGHDRPDGVVDEHVFLRSHTPYVELSPSSDLYWVRAAARTESSSRNGRGYLFAKRPGQSFRVLRASFATRMLEDGTTLPVISGALGKGRTLSSAMRAGPAHRPPRNCIGEALSCRPGRARRLWAVVEYGCRQRHSISAAHPALRLVPCHAAC